ncbi:Inner kinetochore subunit MCM21 [Candida tropicalis]
MNSIEEIEKLQQEIDEISQDILLIEKDIASNQLTKQQLIQDISSIQPSNSIHTETNDEEPIDLDIPETIKHNYLDESIMKYFQPKLQQQNKSTLSGQQQQQQQQPTLPIYDIELKENILYENIYRMFGITSFPINQYLFPNNQESILGLRFEIFSNFNHSYNLPYYCILKKTTTIKDETSIDNWMIYKHTLPSFINLDDLSIILNRFGFTDQENLTKFSDCIYEILNKIQYKIDKFEKLMNFSKNQFGLISESPIFDKINYDLQCQRITLSFNKLNLELVCSEDTIQVANFGTSGNNLEDRLDNQLLMCKTILENCKISNLVKNFKKVIQILIKYRIIQ